MLPDIPMTFIGEHEGRSYRIKTLDSSHQVITKDLGEPGEAKSTKAYSEISS